MHDGPDHLHFGFAILQQLIAPNLNRLTISNQAERGIVEGASESDIANFAQTGLAMHSGARQVFLGRDASGGSQLAGGTIAFNRPDFGQEDGGRAVGNTRD